MRRKERLFSEELRRIMDAKDIFFILVQIEEAHTELWPQGVIKLGVPHVNLADRVSRANAFNNEEIVGSTEHFKVLVDPWNNAFANRYRAWPDKYYLFDVERKVVAKSTYGAHKDALIDEDCVDLIVRL